MKYKSSYLTFFYKYVVLPSWIVIFSLGLIAAWNKPDPQYILFTWIAVLMIVYLSLWLIPFALRLKSVELYDEKMIVKSMWKEIEIGYGDIEWVHERTFMKPALVSVKLPDKIQLPFSKIFIISKREKRFQESKMAGYLREQMKKRNNEDSEKNKPAKWFPFVFLFLTISIIVFLNLIMRI